MVNFSQKTESRRTAIFRKIAEGAERRFFGACVGLSGLRLISQNPAATPPADPVKGCPRRRTPGGIVKMITIFFSQSRPAGNAPPRLLTCQDPGGLYTPGGVARVKRLNGVLRRFIAGGGILYPCPPKMQIRGFKRRFTVFLFSTCNGLYCPIATGGICTRPRRFSAWLENTRLDLKQIFRAVIVF